MTADWTVVIPVKGGPDAKSRMGGETRLELAEAIALDTVSAAVTTGYHVIVVSSASWVFEGAEVIADPGAGLGAAIEAGLAAGSRSTTAGTGVAVLLGDLPGLRPAELADALDAASAHALAFVADADGTGTVLAAALNPAEHRLAFGPDSAAAHRAAGYWSSTVTGPVSDETSTSSRTSPDSRWARAPPSS